MDGSLKNVTRVFSREQLRSQASDLINFKMRSQDGAKDGSRVACSGKTLQFFVCFICFFVVLRVRCC